MEVSPETTEVARQHEVIGVAGSEVAAPRESVEAVAGGAGKHSAFIPAFGNTAASSIAINKT